jgi:hypothetical protein
MTNLPTWLVVTLTLAAPLSALLGVLLTLGFNWLNADRTAEREHAAWLRGKQYEEYTTLMVAAAQVHRWYADPEKGGHEKWDSAWHMFRDAVERALLITPTEDVDKVRGSAVALMRATENPDAAAVAAKGKELRDLLHPYLVDPKYRVTTAKASARR